MKRFATAALWVAAVYLVAFGLISARAAENPLLNVVGSTPDLSLSGGATTDFPVPGGEARWIYIKNDCASDIYFDLNPKVVADSTSYPIRLAQNQTFEGYFRLRTLGASSSQSSGTCTFTVQFGV